MNIGDTVYITTQASVVNLVQLKKGVQIYQGIIENFDKDNVCVKLKDTKNQDLLTIVAKDNVYPFIGKALEKIAEILKPSTDLTENTIRREDLVLQDGDINESELIK